jgi:polysaccharide deacetylase 2 family uncharacterized protein YibQ
VVRRRPGGRRRSPTPRRGARGRSRRRNGSWRAGRWALLLLVAAGLFAAGLYLGSSDLSPGRLLSRLGGGEEGAAGATDGSGSGAGRAAAPRSADRPAADAPSDARSDAPSDVQAFAARGAEHEFAVETVPEAPRVDGPPPLGRGAVVSVVIDDLGRSLSDLDTIAGLGVPVTYAVLPFESRTSEVVAALERRGVEVIVHLPMEPTNGADPGPGALTESMSRRQLARATRRALEAVPGAIGVNNHMGSRLSADRGAMDAILGVIGRHGLYFLDSRTSAESVGYRAARDLDLPAAERQVFLDPDPRPEAVRYQFRRLLEEARKRGSAIAIGHPHPETLRVLQEEVPQAAARGYRFVPVSYVLDRSSVAAK